MTADPTPATTVAAWLERFAACVRARDLDAGRAMFDPTCRSFGTRAAQVDDLDELVSEQWSHIWNSTNGFTFDLATLTTFTSEQRDQAVAIVRWTSTGERADSSTFDREGRATIVLHADATSPDGWLAVHTHFSETPREPHR